MAGPVPDMPRIASPLFLTEPEIRHGIELMFFGYGQLTRAVDTTLSEHGIGRAHSRALYFIGRRPNLSVGELLTLLAITKQSLGRVLTELMKRGLVESRPGDRDRRQRLLRLTPDGAALEGRLFAALSSRMAEAYSRAGQEAVGGFWGVLEGLVPARDRGKLIGRAGT